MKTNYANAEYDDNDDEEENKNDMKAAHTPNGR